MFNWLFNWLSKWRNKEPVPMDDLIMNDDLLRYRPRPISRNRNDEFVLKYKLVSDKPEALTPKRKLDWAAIPSSKNKRRSISTMNIDLSKKTVYVPMPIDASLMSVGVAPVNPTEQIAHIQVFDLSEITSPYPNRPRLLEYTRIDSDWLNWAIDNPAEGEIGYLFSFTNMGQTWNPKVACLFKGHWYLPKIGDAEFYNLDNLEILI